MSLRTKILAAVVGLNLAVLVLAVAVLVVGGADEEGGVPVGVLFHAARVEENPGDGPEARAARARAVADLRAWGREGGAVRTVLWLEEDPADVSGGAARVLDGGDAPDPREVEAARQVHARARSIGRDLYQGDWFLLLLRGGAEEPPAPDGPRPPAQSLFVRWVASRDALGAARVLYFTLLGGIVAVGMLGWVLLSRLVVRPLAALARAADRMAGGDLTARVRPTGRGDEFDRTAAAFDRMAEEIAEHQAHLEDRVMAALARVRRAEQHLAIAQRLAATGKLASGIAHEINNPLGGMRSAVRALQRGGLDAAKTAEYLALVLDGLARVEETVRKVLQFTPRTPSPRAADLGEVARAAAAFARHRVESKGATLVERLPDAPVRVFGDAHELQQVVLNLLLNAADAVAEGAAGRPGGRVELEVSEEGEVASLVVRDDGVGMSPEVAAQCFDLFFTTKEVGEGTGLGLAIVHTIVTNHGGRIEVESAPGRGSTFRVLLPRDAGAAEPATAPGPDAGGGRATP